MAANLSSNLAMCWVGYRNAAKVSGPSVKVTELTAPVVTSTAHAYVSPNMFERNTTHFASGVKLTFGSSR